LGKTTYATYDASGLQLSSPDARAYLDVQGSRLG